MFIHHEPHVLHLAGTSMTLLYRSALLRCEGGQCLLILPGHPLDGVYRGPFNECRQLIDCWRDRGVLPLNFFMPG